MRVKLKYTIFKSAIFDGKSIPNVNVIVLELIIKHKYDVKKILALPVEDLRVLRNSLKNYGHLEKFTFEALPQIFSTFTRDQF